MVKINLDGPKKGKEKDFWNNYEDDISEYDDDSEEDFNDGDWEESDE